MTANNESPDIVLYVDQYCKMSKTNLIYDRAKASVGGKFSSYENKCDSTEMDCLECIVR